MENFDAPKPMSDEKGYLTDEQYNLLIAELNNRSARDKMLFMYLALTGRRISEVVRGTNRYGIRVKDIDFQAHTVSTAILKKHPRKRLQIDEGVPRREPIIVTLPINSLLTEMLKNYIETKRLEEDDFLFDITRQRAFQLCRSISKKSGIGMIGNKQFHPHHLRHTFAVKVTMNRDMKPDELVMLSRLMGHSSIDTTKEYLKFGSTRMRSFVDSLTD